MKVIYQIGVGMTLACVFATNLQAQAATGKTNEELARELANPNTPLASIKFKFQHRTYDGDLQDVDEQESTIIMFQPTLPFPVSNGKTIYVRPGIPLILDQPIVDGISYIGPGLPAVADPELDIDWDSESGIGDTTLDVQYGTTESSGLLWSIGATMTLPTATDKTLGADKWALGPGFQLGRVSKSYVLGFFTNHQWDFAGSGDGDVNLTTTQIFAVYLPGGGWSIASSPIINYNHQDHDWTVPINVAIGKTLQLNGRPWKFALEVNYYVERSDLFGPEWMIGFNVAPVVENMIARWFK